MKFCNGIFKFEIIYCFIITFLFAECFCKYTRQNTIFQNNIFQSVNKNTQKKFFTESQPPSSKQTWFLQWASSKLTAKTYLSWVLLFTVSFRRSCPKTSILSWAQKKLTEIVDLTSNFDFVAETCAVSCNMQQHLKGRALDRMRMAEGERWPPWLTLGRRGATTWPWPSRSSSAGLAHLTLRSWGAAPQQPWPSTVHSARWRPSASPGQSPAELYP
jgi:hypothetical protein